MPVYEFSCNGCGARVSIFTRSIGAPYAEVCDRCGGTDLRRLISKVAILRPPGDPSSLNEEALFDGVDYDDPRSVARWTRQLHEQMGDELSPEMGEALERLERGEGSLDDLMGPDGDDFGSGLDGGDDDWA